MDKTLIDLSNYTSKSADGKMLVPAVISLFQDFEKKVGSMFQDLRQDLVNMFKERDDKIIKMEAQIRQMTKKMDKLELKIDDNDAYERRDTVIISGKAVPAVTNNENPLELMLSLVREKLKINISPSDISAIHRLGAKKAKQGPDHRELIVKFCRVN